MRYPFIWDVRSFIGFPKMLLPVLTPHLIVTCGGPLNGEVKNAGYTGKVLTLPVVANFDEDIDIETIFEPTHYNNLRLFFDDAKEKNEVIFCFIGKLEYRKGIITLLDAFQRLLVDRVKARLLIVGNGALTSKVLDNSSTQPDTAIAYFGPLRHEQLPFVLENMDVLIMPSHNEGVPRVILEAFLFSKPVISTPVGGVPDLITDGENGLLVPVGDEPAMYLAMKELATDYDKRKKLSETIDNYYKPDNWNDAVKTLIKRLNGVIE
jgi:glycosyltransferase involved in cell wall biosynthesis